MCSCSQRRGIYDPAGEKLIKLYPVCFGLYGKQVHRVDEQGNEQMVQNFKGAIRHKVGKVRKVREYIRNHKVVKLTETTHMQALKIESLRVDAMHSVVERMTHRNKLGKQQQAAKDKLSGKRVKREHLGCKHAIDSAIKGVKKAKKA